MKKLLMLLMGFALAGIIQLAPMAGAAERLVIQTIPQEDQLREKGVMILCPSGLPADPNGVLCNAQRGVWNGTACTPTVVDPCTLGQEDKPLEVRDLHAEYKIDIRLDGVNVHPDFFTCNVIEKEVCHIPPEVEKGQLSSGLNEATELFDVGHLFLCILNDIDKDGDLLPDGVGVMEVYYLGSPDDERLIGDHIVKVEACARGVCGAEIQDLCILAAPSCGVFKDCTEGSKLPNFKFPVKWSDARAEQIWKFADPIYPFASCKNLGVQQREIYINTATTSVPDCVDIIPLL